MAEPSSDLSALRARIAQLREEDMRQGARILCEWAGDRQRASGKWTTREQAAVECAIRLEVGANLLAVLLTPTGEAVCQCGAAKAEHGPEGIWHAFVTPTGEA